MWDNCVGFIILVVYQPGWRWDRVQTTYIAKTGPLDMSFWRNCLMPCSSHTLLSMQSLLWFVFALHVSEVTTTLSLVVLSLANTIYDSLNIPPIFVHVFDKASFRRLRNWDRCTGLKEVARLIAGQNFHILMGYSFDASDHGWLDLRTRNLQNFKKWHGRRRMQMLHEYLHWCVHVTNRSIQVAAD